MGLKILEISDKCTACGACVSICPKNALAMQPQGKVGFYYPVVDTNKCVDCHLCEKTCHVYIGGKGVHNESHPYMLKANDKSLIKASSSGGAFSYLADIVLSSGGIVYGAAYNYEKERLEESSTETVGIEALRKSKYIESYCGSIFKDVEEKVKSGRKVLFCGTPCQIKGLSNYLSTKKCDTSNIILVQFLCHGVPSNAFYTEYKHFLEKKYGGKMTSMDFRYKKYGWRTAYYHFVINNRERVLRGDATTYMNSFFKYYMLRDSCYGCRIFDEGFADITIADFWGIFKYDSQNKENEGISLVIAHNEKADNTVRQLESGANVQALPLSAIEYTRKPQTHVNEMKELKSQMTSQIVKTGYIPYMSSYVKKDVRKAIIKDVMAKLLFNIGIWKTNE